MKFILILNIFFAPLFAQDSYDLLITEMMNFEKSVSATYKEYQWLYYEEKQSAEELLVYEELLGVYVQRLKEAYETMSLLSENDLNQSRDIAARALIFRALTFLEKAPIDVTYFERACYDYYEALQLYEMSESVPVIFKDLPRSIRVGGRFYNRLIDLLDEKGHDLFAFGQVYISIRNFRVTSPFDIAGLQLVKHTDSHGNQSGYTYRLAEARLREGFRTAMQTNRQYDLYLGLPAGTYYIRSTNSKNNEFVNLATIYVRPNQFIAYVVEPIADWVIFYETPEKLININANEVGRIASTLDTTQVDSTTQQAHANGVATKSEKNEGNANNTARSIEAISKIVENELKSMNVDELDSLPISRTRKEFVQGVAQIIVSKVHGEYLSSWNRWTLSWTIAKSVTEYFAANKQVSLPMVKLTHDVIRQLI